MAKRTFASRTFKSRTFRSATWAGAATRVATVLANIYYAIAGTQYQPPVVGGAAAKVTPLSIDGLLKIVADQCPVQVEGTANLPYRVSAPQIKLTRQRTTPPKVFA